MLNSLKFKLTIITFLIVSAVMAVSTYRDIMHTEERLLDVQKEKAELLSDRISHGIMMLMLQNKWKEMQVMMEDIVANAKDLKEIQIFRPENGIVVVSSKPDTVGKKIYSEDWELFQKGNNETFIIEKDGQRYASKLTVINNQRICYRCHGSKKKELGVLDIEVSLAAMTSIIDEVKKERFTEAVVGFMLILGAFVVVVGIMIDRPVKKMIKTIRKIEDGDLSARMEGNNNDEFGLVAKSFNRMLETLDSANREIAVCHAEHMQRADRLASLGEIISGIAHEIKNPLTGISCAVQVIQSEMKEDDSNREVATEILNHIKRLDRTVKDLLNYAKPKHPNFQPLKVTDVLDKAIFFVYTEAKKHNVFIEMESDGDIPDVMMDSDQMQQVFLNLIINSIQAMPDGGKLKIIISEAEKENQGITPEIREKLAGEKVLLISFRDTGKGIEKDFIESIFDPFFTKKSKGTGLGLAISQRIIHEHGGDIAVSSEVGKGSEFTIYLPIENA